jgi:predicted PurR-regulated permease PerM
MPARVLSGEVTRTTLAVILIGVLIAACFWIMQPFLYAIIWAAMIVISTWPLLISLQSRLGGRRWAAVVIMTLILLCILFIPLILTVMVTIDKAQELFALSQSPFAGFKLPAVPVWVEKIPLFGRKIVSLWDQYGSLETSRLTELISPYYEKILLWVVAQAENFGLIIINSLVTIVIAAILYVHGEAAGKGVCRFVRRIAGEHGENAALLAAKAVRSVALGIVVTAVIQSFLTYAGLLLAGIPGVVLLTAITFIMCVAQVGPLVVLVPVTIWLFYNDHSGWGWFMIVWTVVIETVDNSMLIKKGVDLPLLLIFAGVLGGLISFGILGLFIGPVVFAVTYTLLKEWISSGEALKKDS